MQGHQETIVSLTDKNRVLKKIVFWKATSIKGDFSNFPSFSKLPMEKSNIKELQKLHLTNDDNNEFIDMCFSSTIQGRLRKLIMRIDLPPWLFEYNISYNYYIL